MLFTTNRFLQRMGPTLEIVCSKIVPAGIGWQAASVAASNLDPLLFSLATGAGDGCMVLLGHQAWHRAKKACRQTVDLDSEKQISYWLGSAAACSGAAWQPVVDLCAPYGLFPTMALTSAACGAAFYTGLRVFRRVYRVPGSNTDDAQLAASIGGATGAFVLTDPLLNGGMVPFLEIATDASVYNACLTAGASTGLGFMGVQGLQNAWVERAYTDKKK